MEGATASTREVLCTVGISTHAPARGATRGVFLAGNLRLTISTHAPTGGTTLCSGFPATMKSYFYSRPCARTFRGPFLLAEPVFVCGKRVPDDRLKCAGLEPDLHTLGHLVQRDCRVIVMIASGIGDRNFFVTLTRSKSLWAGAQPSLA